MTVDGREDLFNYTYLKANNYLGKFRKALGLPNLSLPLLAALLKTFNNKTKLVGFIVKDKSKKRSLYYKQTLNKILGMSNDGHFYMQPEKNPNLQMLHRIIDEWDMRAAEKENQPHYDIPSYQNDDEDMQKVSDNLIQNDNYEEINESKKGKKIYITESQFNELKQRISESYFVEPEKVKIVEKFLDDTFVKGAVPSIGEDGYAKPIFIVGMKIPYSDKFKNMTATQAFYMLQDKFKNIYSDPKQRDSFLKKVLVDWYNGKISKHGLLSINNY